MSTPQYTARRSAVFLLDQVLGEGRLMSDLIASGKLDQAVTAGQGPGAAAGQRHAART